MTIADDIDHSIRKCLAEGWQTLEVHLSKSLYSALLATDNAHLQADRSGPDGLVGRYRGYPVYLGDKDSSSNTVLNRFADGSMRGWAIVNSK